jgi:hypothetical protein
MARTTRRRLADNQRRTCQEFSPCHAILLWRRTGDIPRLKGLIAIFNISLTRNATGAWASHVMVARYGMAKDHLSDHHCSAVCGVTCDGHGEQTGV